MIMAASGACGCGAARPPPARPAPSWFAAPASGVPMRTGRLQQHAARALAAQAPGSTPKPQPPGQQQQQQFEQLRTWLTSRGGSMGAITAGDCQMGPVTVRGLIAQQDLASGTPVLSVPVSVALRDDTATPPYPGAPWNACLAAQLLRERDQGGSSSLSPYLATLPSDCCSPLLLPPQQLQEVQYAPAVAAIHSYQQAAQAAYHLCCQAGGGTAVQQRQYSWEEWAWALHMVQSRSIRLAITGCKVMIPGIDLLNHGGDAANGQLVLGKASWQLEGEPAVCFVTTQDIPAGQQVLWSYGRRSNDDFFAYHGFVLADNPDEDAVLFADVASLVCWALQHARCLQGLQQHQQLPQLQQVAAAAAARAAQAAAAYCSSAAIPGTTSSLLAPLQPLAQQAGGLQPSISRQDGAAGPCESAVLAALRGAQLHRRLASFRLHSPEWGDAASCPPVGPELVLRRDGCLDVRVPAVLAALLDAAAATSEGGAGSTSSDWLRILHGVVAARCAEMLAAFPTSLQEDQQKLLAGGQGSGGIMAGVLQYRVAKKQLLRDWAVPELAQSL